MDGLYWPPDLAHAQARRGAAVRELRCRGGSPLPRWDPQRTPRLPPPIENYRLYVYNVIGKS